MRGPVKFMPGLYMVLMHSKSILGLKTDLIQFLGRLYEELVYITFLKRVNEAYKRDTSIDPVYKDT